MPEIYPVELARGEQRELLIVWNDGAQQRIPFQRLRESCPCATCREKRNAPAPPATSLPVISPQEAQPPAIAAMKPVGNYAYSITFSDGHDTGIFTFDFLRELGGEAS